MKKIRKKILENLGLKKEKAHQLGESPEKILEKAGWTKVKDGGSFLGWLEPKWTNNRTVIHTTEEAIKAQRVYDRKCG